MESELRRKKFGADLAYVGRRFFSKPRFYGICDDRKKKRCIDVRISLSKNNILR